MISHVKLFLIFVKIGAILLGGGYVIFPILEQEFIEKRNLISADDLVDYYAISQSLPGLIAANISMFIGYKLLGKTGAVIAMLGIVCIPFLCIVCLASVLGLLLCNTYIQGALWGISVSIIVMIFLTIREMWQKSDKNLFFYTIYITALFALIVIKLSPIQVIILMTAIGLLCKIIQKKVKN